MDSYMCPMCGKFKEAEYELCRRCETAQEHHPEEVATREMEIRGRMITFFNEFHWAASGQLSSWTEKETFEEAMDYILGLLK